MMELGAVTRCRCEISSVAFSIVRQTIQKDYRFGIAFESSNLHPHYVSEKIVNAFLAGQVACCCHMIMPMVLS